MKTVYDEDQKEIVGQIIQFVHSNKKRLCT